MPYTINLTNGSSLVPGGLSDGTVDSSHSSIILIGKNYANYGTFLNDNLVHMLENFSNQASPPNPIQGQLWWDSNNKILRVYTGVSWKISTGATSATYSNPPSDTSSLGGDLWFDTSNSQLNVWSGSSWITVGPVSTPATGNSGAIPALMTDVNGASHVVIQFIISGTIYAIVSKDAFASSLYGFPIIRAGINFSTQASPVWGLNTQDVNPTNNTLVQRDATGGVNAVTLNATTVAASTVNATNLNGSFTGNLYGNVLATTVSATSSVSAPAFLATSYQGTIVTAYQPNITTLGIVQNLNATGNAYITGRAYYNNAEIATQGGAVAFSSINSTPIGNATPNTGAFTTLSTAGTTTANGSVIITGNLSASNYVITPTVLAAQIGNTATVLTGTLNTSAQPGITSATGLVSIGNITSGAWSGTIVQPSYGGTGSNNGANTIVATTNILLNQNVAANSSPTLRGTNFNNIPNNALVAGGNINMVGGTGISVTGTMVPGGTVTIGFTGSPVVGVNGTTNQILVTGAANAPTLATPQNIHTGANFQVNSLGVGVAATATTGEIRAGIIRASDNVVAYYSDDRLKTRLGKIENALDKLCSLEGFYYEANQTAQDLGYTVQREMGVSAQKTQLVAPEIVKPAPIDESKYLTVQYERFAPLIIEAIKELRAEVNDLKNKIS